MKPFKLEEAKAGKPVCTRDGRKARIFCFDFKNRDYPIVAALQFEDGKEELVATFTEQGNNSKRGVTEYDLFMAEEESPTCPFKPFDKVLVRDNNSIDWMPTFFNYFTTDEKYFSTVSGYYNQCIPFNRETKHLVGTNKMPPKKYIIWSTTHD